MLSPLACNRLTNFSLPFGVERCRLVGGLSTGSRNTRAMFVGLRHSSTLVWRMHRPRLDLTRRYFAPSAVTSFPPSLEWADDGSGHAYHSNPANTALAVSP